MNQCKCGCHLLCRRNYVRGHNKKGMTTPLETREKQSRAALVREVKGMSGHQHKPESIAKIRNNNLGKKRSQITIERNREVGKILNMLGK